MLVFQKGYLHGVFGFQQTPTIENWITVFLLCVLFGLSMDYHVFLLSRIREHYDATHDNRESVAVGLQATAKIITGAALIMVAVFAGFASGQLVMFQQMGFGLAVAVLIDATIVRSVLVPASMALLATATGTCPPGCAGCRTCGSRVPPPCRSASRWPYRRRAQQTEFGPLPLLPLPLRSGKGAGHPRGAARTGGGGDLPRSGPGARTRLMRVAGCLDDRCLTTRSRRWAAGNLSL